MKMVTIRVKKATWDDFYYTKQVRYETLAPSMYNFKPTSFAGELRQEVKDGFQFESIGKSQVAGSGFWFDRETAYLNVHPEDKHILDELIANAS